MSKAGRATPEEIWTALQAQLSGERLSDIARKLCRNPKTVGGWLQKYADYSSLDELKMALNPNDTRYVQIMRKLFEEKWEKDSEGFEWEREDLSRIADDLRIKVPKNLGDNIYSIRHGREDLPDEICALAPPERAWLLLPNGKGKYRFVLAERAFLDPDLSKQPIKIPDSTPQIVARYAKTDEQAVLARIRYCRLIDIFMGLASFQLQSHMRTTIAHFNGSQTELDEVYVGVDVHGTQFVIPIQAKGDDERIGVVQIIGDYYTCAEKFPEMVGRTVAAKTIKIEETEGFGQIFTIALIEATVTPGYNVRKLREEHFQLVPAAFISDSDLAGYRGLYRASHSASGAAAVSTAPMLTARDARELIR